MAGLIENVAGLAMQTSGESGTGLQYIQNHLKSHAYASKAVVVDLGAFHCATRKRPGSAVMFRKTALENEHC